MSGETLHLTITTPTNMLVDQEDVVALRAEDRSGGFGILPGHTEFLTALPASVVRWHTRGGRTRYCAVQGGLMTVEGGTRIAIACRRGMTGEDLEDLEAQVEALRTSEEEAGRRARVEQMRLHARAVRQLIRYLRPGRPGGAEQPMRPSDIS